MSWYRDPQLFIFTNGSTFEVYRVTKGFGILPLSYSDTSKLEGPLSFSRHLSFGNNRESDYNAFKASIQPKSRIEKMINSQGWVIYWDIARQCGTWSVEERNSPFWRLPGIKTPEMVQAETRALQKENSELKAYNSKLEEESKRIKQEKAALEEDRRKLKQALEKRVLDLEAENSICKAQVNAQRDEKSALIKGLEKQVIDLTSRLVQCCGAAEGGSSVEEPWISSRSVPSNWLPSEDLDVLAFPRNTPLTISKATGGRKFQDDRTTNVHANRFYGGIFPIVVVDVGELTPNREDARFDPCVWGLYNNGGISYAARKPFASEMSVDAHKTC